MTKMLTPTEVAEMLNISYGTALNFVKYSGIPYVKLGRQYRVSEAHMAEILKQDDTVFIDMDEPA